MGEEQKTERVQLLMTPSEVKTVDDWSFANRVRGRSEAIRRLIELGLKKAPVAPVEGGSLADQSRGTDWPDLAVAVHDAEKENR